MWSIRVLSGEMAGRVFPLKSGTNLIGRAPHCDVALATAGVSKEHAQIEIVADKIILTDKGSRNGTFINGVAVRSQIVQPGQKIAIYDVICEIVPGNLVEARKKQPTKRPRPQPQAPLPNYGHGGPSFDGNLAYQQQTSSPESSPDPGPAASTGLAGYVMHYLDHVVMPAVYQIPKVVEFRNVVAIFGLVLVVLITALSTIPLTGILKKRIEKTSQQRALTIARTLSVRNQPILAAGQMTGLTTTEASNEPGVDKAFIVSLEGRILAPAVLAQRDPEIPFIAEARRFGKEVVQQIDDNTIGALVPIVVPNDQGLVQALAHAVVMYDMGTLAVDDSQTFSLFVQTLAIALVLGAIVFFFIYKIVVFPITSLNSQLGAALRDNSIPIQTDYQFPELRELAANIQSIVARGGSGGFDQPGAYEHDRSTEAMALTSLVGYPSLAIRTQDEVVMSVNSVFQEHIAKGQNWNQIRLDDVFDQALKLNLKDVVEKAKQNPNQSASDHIDVDGQNYQVTGQAIFGSKEVSYVMISLVPKTGGA